MRSQQQGVCCKAMLVCAVQGTGSVEGAAQIFRKSSADRSFMQGLPCCEVGCLAKQVVC